MPEAVVELNLEEKPIENLPGIEPKTDPDKISLSSFLLETIQTIILAVVLYFLIDTVVARVRVEHVSMVPTLHPGEFILVNKMAYRLDSPALGDIVVFHYPENPTEDYIKRVIGTPGDIVRAENGKIFVNGNEISEPYISAPVEYSGEWTVPEDALFVLGDNRNQSSDSHKWGFVPYRNIVGKALVVYWPLNEMKVLSFAKVVNAAN